MDERGRGHPLIMLDFSKTWTEALKTLAKRGWFLPLRSTEKRVGFEGLRTALREAGTLKHNSELACLVYDEASAMLVRLTQRGTGATERETHDFLKARTTYHRQRIAARWRSQPDTSE